MKSKLILESDTELRKDFLDYVKDFIGIITLQGNLDHCHCYGKGGHKVRYHGGKPYLEDSKYWTESDIKADASFFY